MTWLDTINNFLAALPNTGTGGFEGLVVSLLEAATGQRFRLSGSGHQAGQDARSETGFGNRIKVEAKHYRKASLDLRELTAEIAQATESDPLLDLWVLVASCPIADQHATELEAQATRYGIETVLVDGGNAGLSRLVVLLSAYSNAVTDWIARNDTNSLRQDLDLALAEVEKQDGYEETLSQVIRKLGSTQLGLADACRRVSSQFLRVLSDRGDANAFFAQDSACRAIDVRTVVRGGLFRRLDGWWNDESKCKRAAILGEEGTGKTWATMEWIARLIEHHTNVLIIPFSSYAESIPEGTTIDSLLARVLTKWTGMLDDQHWQRRLTRWLSDSTSTAPRILVVADGLNERPHVDWPSFLRTLDRSEWRSSVAILATDREGHWRPRCARSGVFGFQEIRVDGFDDSELIEALGHRSFDLRMIPLELEDLIRKPRYFALVCDHFEELKRDQDFTVERLLWLDAKHRAEKKRGQLSETAFMEIVRNAATRYLTRPEVRLTEVRSLVPEDDPEGKIHQEIVDGGILTPKAGFPGAFQVSRPHLIFGLGMLLAEELRDACCLGSEDVAPAEKLVGWFEPHREMDLKVSIAASALYHSVADLSYPEEARRELVHYWLTTRNWDAATYEALIGYVLGAPTAFLAVTDELWANPHHFGGAQDFLADTYSQYRDEPRLQVHLVGAVSRWMGVVHPTRHPHLRSDENRRVEIEARVGQTLTPGALGICGYKLAVFEDDGALGLPRLALKIISAGARRPFIEAFVTWALAGAVMRTPIDGKVVDWVIRLADEPVEDLLLEKVRALLEVDNRIAMSAAQILLRHLDSPDAQPLREEYPERPDASWLRLKQEHAADPCKGAFGWAEEDCAPCMERTDVSPIYIIQRLSHRLFDPTFRVSESLVDRAVGVLSAKPTEYWASVNPTEERYFFDSVLPVLASRAPVRLADIVRAAVRTAPTREFQTIYPLAISCPKFSLVFSAEEVAALLKTLRQLHANGKYRRADGKSEVKTVAESFIFLALAPHLSEAELADLLLERPADAEDLLRLQDWFKPLSKKQVEQLLKAVHTSEDHAKIIRSLWLLSFSECPLSTDNRAHLIQLARSQNRGVRGSVLCFSYRSQDRELGQELCRVLGDLRGPGDGGFEDVWAINVLVRYSTDLPFSELLSRLDPGPASFALGERGYKPEEVGLFAETMDLAWSRIISADDESEIRSVPPVKVDVTSRLPVPPIVEIENDLREPESARSITEQFARLAQSQDLEEMNRRLQATQKEEAAALLAAWGSGAFAWFSRPFNFDAIDQICRVCPNLVEKWAKEGSAKGLAGERIRARTATLLAPLCQSLLEHSPEVGLTLWSVLRSDGAGLQRIDTARMAFSAPDNAATDRARRQVLIEANNDASLSRVAQLAERHKTHAWFNAILAELLRDSRIYVRAKGLTLASFSNITPDRFDLLVIDAEVKGTWLEDRVPHLRRHLLNNQFARYWFGQYLESTDADLSWGALQMALLCGDGRFFTWPERLQLGSANPDRLTFLNAQYDDVKKKLDREARKKTLFGIPVEDCVHPF